MLTEHEAEQFLYIYQRRAELEGNGEAPQAWFLSFETTLARVFERNGSRWGLPPTFRFTAWAAFLDSRLVVGPEDPGAIVRVILKGHSSALELPELSSIIRSRIVSGTVTTKEEEAAPQEVLSAHGLVTALEKGVAGLRRRGDDLREAARTVTKLEDAAAGEVRSELSTEVRKLSEQIEQLREEVVALSENRSTANQERRVGSNTDAMTPRKNRRLKQGRR